MTDVQVAVEIKTSPEEAFDYYVVPENHQVWQKNLVEVERLSDGPARMGSRFKLRRRLAGRIQSLSAPAQ